MSLISHEAIAKYVQRRYDDLETCQSALAAKDFPLIENIGHKMKGNGLTFGYPELADIGKEMENAAVKKDFELVADLVSTFAKWCEQQKATSTQPPQPEL
jgi:HPt (histidine-containing phosphotransfer) domain-containing protein